MVDTSLIWKTEVRGQVPRKQGLKPDYAAIFGDWLESEGKFQENKD